MNRSCVEGWESLRRDPIPILLEDPRPGVRARVLTDVMGRPSASPAVRRARSGANAVEPVAGLLRELWPDGTWMGRTPRWHGIGEGWRLAEAVAWGADPTCPRLQAGWGVALETLRQDGGWRPRRSSGRPSTAFTARVLDACASVVGLRSDLRLGEAAAWLEDTPCWDHPAVTGVAVLGALDSAGVSRGRLQDRAVDAVLSTMGREATSARLGFPNRLRTDGAEMLAALAMAGVPYQPVLLPALVRLQRRQNASAMWGQMSDDPLSPTIPVTTRALVAMLHFAPDAALPRLFPEKPKSPRPTVSSGPGR